MFDFIAAAFKQLKEVPHNYKPQLDYLRVLAILLVFLTHTSLVFRNYQPINFLTEFPPILAGWTGVDLFFVLSGFLIGGQLWKEYQKKGTIDYRRFFIKRTLRIWPLYYAVLIVFIVIRGSIKPSAYYADLYFLSNYLGQGALMGSWSLAAEEQFYILLPLLILLFSIFKLSYKTGRYIALAVLFVSPLLRYFWWNHVLKTHPPTVRTEIDYLQYPFHTHLDSLFMGVLLANLYLDESLKSCWKSIGFIFLAATAIVFTLRLSYKIPFNYSLLALMYGSMLWWSLYMKDRLLRALSFKAIPVFARLSFGVYLVHYQFIEWLMPKVSSWFATLPPALNYVLCNLVILAAATIVATITYVAIESPALKWRDQLVEKP